jgi:hypothetical protein
MTANCIEQRSSFYALFGQIIQKNAKRVVGSIRRIHHQKPHNEFRYNWKVYFLLKRG